jgi:hypothetical protein
MEPDGTLDANAFWDSAARRIVMCYAWVQRIEEYSRETIARAEIGQRERMPNPK